MSKKKLDLTQIQYIIKNFDISDELKKKLEEESFLSDDDFDFLRDLCGERLQIFGFDENYQVNEEGNFLENLINKLYIN